MKNIMDFATEKLMFGAGKFFTEEEKNPGDFPCLEHQFLNCEINEIFRSDGLGRSDLGRFDLGFGLRHVFGVMV